MLEAQGLTLGRRITAIDAALAPGQVTAICGPNGAGKSTLLASLAALLPVDAGRALLDGQDLAQLPPRQRAQAIGYLPQAAELAWDVSVATLAGLGRLPWSTSAADNAAAVDAALAALHLDALRGRPVSQLSGGERARALLARVLAGQPRWLLADEPLANLDLAHQLALLAHFRRLAGQGLGVVLVMHDLAQAMNHADRVLVLREGQLVEDGPPETALRAAAISAHWGVAASWLGDAGSRALAVG